eukprot:4925439-Amphidinium_carterae.1
MLPEYGHQQTPTADTAAAGAAEATASQPTSSADATASQPTTSSEAQQQPPQQDQRPFIKWCLINVVIDEQLINSMSDPDAAEQHLETYGFQPSRYNRRYTDYSIELVYNGQQRRDKIDISHVFHI